ncbi:MAG: Holliday junction resolvase RuvX [Thermomicrobium sp.]|nr:Holliday junction resolvase RuvX [Thermomicrobium sp.]MCS7246030.1 Holliday junction resolvase RuvX [Thermomicrobium sp.]MDW7981697.1 Holliday junction resolvase RuvX [Thermomicrobium sp.]
MTEKIEQRGRALGLDVGGRRVGVAISDELGLIASPLTTIDLNREGPEAIVKLVERYAPTVVVVGLPMTMRGQEGAQAAETRRFVEALRPHLSCPIVWWDERLTSTAADRALTAAGLRRGRRRQVVDAVAAALLLQSYLDAQRTGRESDRGRPRRQPEHE